MQAFLGSFSAWYEKNQSVPATVFAQRLAERNDALHARKNDFLGKLDCINAALKDGPLRLWLSLP